MPSPTILICTVGGTHQPIVTAIRQGQPDYVCFVCSEDDPTTRKSGSWTQIQQRGEIIKAHPADANPSLPNIPAQLGLSEECFEVLCVPADDLDAACAAIRRHLTELKVRFPDSRPIADYTGGTKTMTAALVVAALEEGIELQLVTGGRADLVKVGSGMESVLNAPTERIRVQRAMAPFRAAWSRFAYAEAALGFAGIVLPRDAKLRAEIQIWRDTSRALDAWDRFDHAQALATLEPYSKRIGPAQPQLLNALRGLNDTDHPQRREAMRLFDLWHNARRRATQGRYDDAVARGYRLLEWTAQWLLGRHLGIDTADVPATKLPVEFEAKPARDGKIKLGLFDAWYLVGTVEGPLAEFVSNQLATLQNHVKVRNQSILAHGFTPIRASEWKAFSGWLEAALLPLLMSEAKTVGVRSVPSQLPTDQCWM